MTSTSRAQLLLLFTIFVCMASGLNAQNVETRPMRGFMPNMDQLSSPADNIDVATGKLHLQIPLASLPRGIGGTGYDLNLEYDSNIYDLSPQTVMQFNGSQTVETTFNYLQGSTSTGGWKNNAQNPGLETETKTKPINSLPCPNLHQVQIFKHRIRLDDGSLHILYLKGYEGNGRYDSSGFSELSINGAYGECGADRGYTPTPNILSFYTNDGSFLRYEVSKNNSFPSTLYFPDGRRWVWSGNTAIQYDANGNYITRQNICPNNNCDDLIAVITDQNSKTITMTYNTEFATQGSDLWRRTEVRSQGPNGEIVYTIDMQNMRIGQNRQYISGFHYYPINTPDYTSLDNYRWEIKYIHLPLPENEVTPPNQQPYPGALGTPDLSKAAYRYAFGYWGDDPHFQDGTNNPNGQGYGQLNYMRMPSGAVYKYSYLGSGAGCTGELSTYSYLYTNEIVNLVGVCNKTIATDDGTLLNWKFEGVYSDRIFTNPEGGKTQYTLDVNKMITKTQAYGNDGTVKTETRRFWAVNNTPSYGFSPNNSYMQKEIVSYLGTANNKSAVTTFNYDGNGNVLSKTEYNWVSYAADGNVTLNDNMIKRKSEFKYYVTVPGGPPSYEYWNIVGSPIRLNAVQRQTVFEGPSLTPKAATEYIYDDPYSKGNVLYEMHWDSFKAPTFPSTLGSLSLSNSQVLTRSYDSNGNLTDKYEPEVRTHITYDPTGSRVTRVDSAYQTSAQRSTGYGWNTDGTALLSKTDLDNNQTTYFTYDNVGRTLITDEPGLRKTVTDYDDLYRMVTVISDLKTYADGKLQSISHYDRLGREKLVQKSDGVPLSSYTDGIKADTFYRYLPYFSNNLNVGRQVIATSPYRTSTDLTLEWTCTQYDLLGRVTEVASFNGSVPTTLPSLKCENLPNPAGITRTAYDADTLGNTVTVTDPAGKARRQSSDVLGRLVKVVEDPSVVTPPYTGVNYTTTYNYDILGNLTQVNQGAQTRAFTYSSLGRLLTATNPESGTITYKYNDSGDLIKKTDPRGGINLDTSTIYTAMEYDPLHRIQKKSYINTNTSGALASIITPDVTYEYYLAGNSTAPNIGQLKKVSSSVASTTYVYNELGKVSSSSTYNGFSGGSAFSYTYYRNGALKSELYPSGRLVNYDVDDAGRTNRVYTASTDYADEVSFAADGRLKQMKLGDYLWETHDYRTPSATTPTSYMLGTAPDTGNITKLDYFFSPTQNNGNVQSQTILRNNSNSWSQIYGYDNVNRLLTVNEPTGTYPWSQTYGYDQYGNRYIAASGLSLELHEPNSPSNFNAANNRLTTLPTNPVTTINYDAAGNQTNYPPYTLSYDGENRNTVVNLSGSPYVTFSYDGDGRRVRKRITNGATTYYVYDAFGQMAAEYSTQAPTSTGTSYMFTDMLGSVRTITNISGAVVENYDYLPFGRMLSSGINGRNAVGNYPSDPDNNLFNSRTPQKFTGKERDAETGLDFFLARYYSAAQGRFISPDEFKGGPDDALTGADITPPGPLPYADIGNPQSLNKYTYVLNNPLKYTDPDGHLWDTVLDVVGIGYDIYDLASDPSWGKAGTLGLDVVLAAVPFVPTVGGVKAGAKLASKTDDLIDGMRASHAVPNPFGKAGGLKHQAKVEEVANKMSEKGLEVAKEVRVATPGGEKAHRYIDVVGKDPSTGKIVEAHQIGKQTKKGKPVSREGKAITDLEKSLMKKIDFDPYN